MGIGRSDHPENEGSLAPHPSAKNAEEWGTQSQIHQPTIKGGPPAMMCCRRPPAASDEIDIPLHHSAFNGTSSRLA
jgi:hypothetical protein